MLQWQLAVTPESRDKFPFFPVSAWGESTSRQNVRMHKCSLNHPLTSLDVGDQCSMNAVIKINTTNKND